jgi:hypothetical protein
MMKIKFDSSIVLAFLICSARLAAVRRAAARCFLPAPDGLNTS